MLRCARGQAALWEKRLANHGLSNHQFKIRGLQQLGAMGADTTFNYSFDPELGHHWKNGARWLTSQDLSGMGRVPARYTFREVPMWALSDSECRALLLYLYPRLTNPKHRHRRDAGRAALMIYRAYRQCYSDVDIAAELGVTRAAVCLRLQKLKRAGRVLFERAGKT